MDILPSVDDDDDFVSFDNVVSKVNDFSNGKCTTNIGRKASGDLCAVCSKDLTSFNETRRLQHVNRCLDKGEQKSNFEKSKAVYEASIDCPLCNINLPPGPFRIAHLKKCSNENQISVAHVLQLVKTQEQIASVKRSKNLPHTKASAPSFETCAPKKRKNKLMPKSVDDEQLQLAKTLSVSERPDLICLKKTCDIVLTGRNQSKKIVNETTPLQTVSTEERLEKLQDRLFAVINSSLYTAAKQTERDPDKDEEQKSTSWWNLHCASSVANDKSFCFIPNEMSAEEHKPSSIVENSSINDDEINLETEAVLLTTEQNSESITKQADVLQQATVSCLSSDETNSKHELRSETDALSECSDDSTDMFERARASLDEDVILDNDSDDDVVLLIDSTSDQNVEMLKCRTLDSSYTSVRSSDKALLNDAETPPPDVCSNFVADNVAHDADEDLLEFLDKPLFERIKAKFPVLNSNSSSSGPLFSYTHHSESENDIAKDVCVESAGGSDQSKDNSALLTEDVDEHAEQPTEFFHKSQDAAVDDIPEAAASTASITTADDNVNTFTIIKRGNVTPMPDYDKLGTPDLKQELGKYGVRPLARRRAVPLLRKMYSETHPFLDEGGRLLVKEDDDDSVVQTAKRKRPAKNSRRLSCSQPIASKTTEKKVDHKSPKNTPKKKNREEQHMISFSQETKPFDAVSDGEESDRDPVAEESFMPEPDAEPEEKNVNERLLEFFTSDVTLYRKVLKYEPLPLKDMHAKVKLAGIKCSLKCFLDFLDAQCITFTMKDERKKPGVRYRTPKKRRMKAY